MGGLPKGLLVGPDGAPLIERLRGLFERIGVECLLVGSDLRYRHLGMEEVPDATPGIGPIGGLLALCDRGREARVIAVACDMPHVSEALLRRLAAYPSERAVVAPYHEGRWEPLFARYDAMRILPKLRDRIAGKRHSLQGLLDDHGEALPMSSAELAEMRDWDSFDDVGR